VPLWSERGPVGLLLLGEKKEGDFYSQEELEIARASGERLADLLASAELARRLAALQRQRLAESAVLDRQARRALHDEVLPRLHTALLGLSASSLASSPEGGEALDLLAGAHREIADLLRALPARPVPEIARLGLLGALRQLVDGELAGAFDAVTWEIDPRAEAKARLLPELEAEVAYYAAREALRNAARHARPVESGRELRLRISLRWCEGQPHGGLELCIEDNGVGLALAAPAGAYQGSGQGLALHSTLLAILGGELVLESVPEEFTRVSIRLPGERLSHSDPV
jgi:signal transduction histidine kinase